jgi:hypothetical protein
MIPERPQIRFLLDEHYPGWLAEDLEADGVDAVALTAHRSGLRGVDDQRVLEAAVAERRVVVTEDVKLRSLLACDLAGQHSARVCRLSSRSRVRAALGCYANWRSSLRSVLMNRSCKILHLKSNPYTMDFMSAQTLGFAVQSEDRPVLDELVAYFGDGNRSAYLRATLKVMKSIMIANQLREAQAYGQERTAALGIDPADVPARVQEFMKGTPQEKQR